MKNSHLPLIQALKNRIKPKEEPFSQPLEAPRTFEIGHDEIPGLVGHRVGEKISVNLSGHVHSQHADGHTVMHVANVKPDSTEMTEKNNPDRKTPSESGAVNRA